MTEFKASNGWHIDKGPESGKEMLRQDFDAQDFWKNVDVRTDSECWEWGGGFKRKGGYGAYRSHAAHRVSAAITFGRVPRGMTVRHSCDNPPCVNPAHLSFGTQAENVRDREERHRRKPPRGDSNGNSVIRDSDVAKIVEYAMAGESQSSIGKRFGVTRHAIGRILRGQSYQHIDRDRFTYDVNAGKLVRLVPEGGGDE